MKICLDPGHGGSDTGASFNGINESEITLLTSMYLGEILQYECSEEVEVIHTRDTDDNISLKERVRIANENNVDLFISIHTNADADDDTDETLEGKGEEIWIYPNSSSGRKLAEYLSEYVDDIFPEHKFRGIKEAKFYVLRHTKMPAILIEMGFIDNIDENYVFSDPNNMVKMAELIFEGIMDYHYSIGEI